MVCDDRIECAVVPAWNKVKQDRLENISTEIGISSTNHVVESSRSRKRVLSDSIQDPLVYRCDVSTCQMIFKKKYHWTRHYQRKHTSLGSPMSCPRCFSLQFSTKHEYEEHVAQHDKERFACSESNCTKTFTKKEHLTRHMSTHHNSNASFQCTLCQAQFVYKHALTRHTTTCHSTERPYSCSICLLSFKKKTLLQAHSYVHTGILPFECCHCPMRFHKRYQLTRHESIHNTWKGTKQVILCEMCDAVLFSMEEKEKHRNEIHGKESSHPFTCQVCRQTFTRQQNLRLHLRTHFISLKERKQEHNCPVPGCLKSYTKASNVMAHYNAIHDPIKSIRFKCPIEGCLSAFGYKKVLENHLTSVHGSSIKSKTSRVQNSMSLYTRVLGLTEPTIS